MKTGDMVWYNSAGSKQTGLVLEIITVENRFISETPCKMIRIHWNESGYGYKPAVYDSEMKRQFGDIPDCYVRLTTKTGLSMFKVISEA